MQNMNAKIILLLISVFKQIYATSEWRVFYKIVFHNMLVLISSFAKANKSTYTTMAWLSSSSSSDK